MCVKSAIDNGYDDEVLEYFEEMCLEGKCLFKQWSLLVTILKIVNEKSGI